MSLEECPIPESLLSLKEVQRIAGNADRTTIWRWEKAGNFPRSRLIGGRRVWIASEIQDWLAVVVAQPDRLRGC